jgi:hypothetical protein
MCADGGADLLLPDGGRYVGQFNEQRQPHGEGVKFHADGSERASGQWRDGKLHGRGKEIFPKGSRYEGDLIDGKWSGLGTFTWADGRVFQGELDENASNGFGVEWTAAGEMAKCGRWSDDQLVESCPVPRSLIPTSIRVSQKGQLLTPIVAFRPRRPPHKVCVAGC